MSLSYEEILADAGELVSDITGEFSARDLSPEDKAKYLAEAGKVFRAAAYIISTMLEGRGNKTLH